ncbi:hypothetical protein D3C72_723100 [compost metagenome]
MVLAPEFVVEQLTDLGCLRVKEGTARCLSSTDHQMIERSNGLEECPDILFLGCIHPVRRGVRSEQLLSLL